MSRLAHALDAEAVHLPDNGTIAVVEPPLGYDLNCLPRARVIIVSPNYPAHASFEAAGFSTDVAHPASATLSIVVAGKSRERTRGNIATASLARAPIIVDGDKTVGIGSLYKALKALVPVSEAHSKAHGKVFSLPPSDALRGWLAGPKEANGFRTWPGVFSEDKIDKGSKLLAETLPQLAGRVADLGSGWGYLAHQVLSASPDIAAMFLVEADSHAVSCGQENVPDPRAEHIWGDATKIDLGGDLDHVVANPPFHKGRAADPGLGQAFIQSAARNLGPKGTLWLVANRQLPYEGVLVETFREVEEIAGDPKFKVFCAKRPR